MLRYITKMVRLSEINSKNYKVILDKVKYASLTSVPDSLKLMTFTNAYNIKTANQRIS